jgi:uncharacterized protein
MDAEHIKRLLGLKPLPVEGGFYAEPYRSDENIPRNALAARYGGERCFGTAIYFLLTAEAFSALHRLQSDEVYHFYLGDPVEVLLLREDGAPETVTIGTDLAQGMRPQLAVRRETWQGLKLKSGGTFALLGTTVSPGFEFDDFELGDRRSLLAAYPDLSEMIRKFTR